MMRDDDPDLVDQAIGWHLRRAEMSGEDWRGFILWLEQSPAHAAAYDRVAMQDRLLPAPAAPLAPANDDEAIRRRWPLVAGGALAAAAAAAFLLPMAWTPSAEPYVVDTQPGQRQTVQLAADSRIELSGGARLHLDRADPRSAELEAGEAAFTVRHDPAHPFSLRSGTVTISDLGTVFDVLRAGPRLDVQVAEGSVQVEAGGQRLTLGAGEALAIREDNGQIVRTRLPVEAVGGWRSGQLRFQNDPLPAVAAALYRTTGTRVALGGDLPARSFTGSVQLTGAPTRDIPHLAALMGVDWRQDGGQWILTPRTAATH